MPGAGGRERNSRDCKFLRKLLAWPRAAVQGEELRKEGKHSKSKELAHSLSACVLGRFQAVAKHRPWLLQQEKETPGVEFRNPKAFRSQQTVTLNRRWQGQDT